jgi:hypothetical protein
VQEKEVIGHKMEWRKRKGWRKKSVINDGKE